eukprot:CAMPEP_0183370886 /NCGR_PEP_ID=MMETSP0164_2-20130417/103772_1 /TAXON_ID=221442 /ORGANISM="Coccolithus pelagicus ssp braarudi, Strain PLY182g" /LENGTH=33 /DNA_ID= /DNA_START= /DNA_END= /DNA_ORIENTATION=
MGAHRSCTRRMPHGADEAVRASSRPMYAARTSA